MNHLFLIAGLVVLTMVACSNPPTEPVEPAANLLTPTQILLTQAMLDSVITILSPADTAITGNGFGVRTDGSERSLKDIYTNKPLNRLIQTGDIFVIRSFGQSAASRSQLEFVDLMVRREDGFNPVGGGFEYFRIDYDSTTDYGLHPNGLVPTLSNNRDRGLDIARAGCVSCHRLAGGSDFMFTAR